MWSHKFDYSERHCSPINDGRYIINGSMNDECDNASEHPMQAGRTEFIRWIQTLNTLIPGLVSGLPDGVLKLGPAEMSTAPYHKMTCYCENYGDILKAFLNVKEGWAIVEITDEHPELFPFADRAVELVKESYQSIT